MPIDQQAAAGPRVAWPRVARFTGIEPTGGGRFAEKIRPSAARPGIAPAGSRQRPCRLVQTECRMENRTLDRLTMRPRRPWHQRLLAAAVLLAYLAGTIGLPLPAPATVEGDEDAAAAAALHRCGCPTDEVRQGSCCCSAGGCCGAGSEDAPTGEADPVRWSGGGWSARCRGEGPAWLLVALPAVALSAAIAVYLPAPAAPPHPADEDADRLTLPFPDPPPRLPRA